MLFGAGIRYTPPQMKLTVSHERLEPSGLWQHFMTHPPIGFEACGSADEVPGFLAEFDLLTTAEDDLQRRLAAIPGGRWLRRLLRLRTYFVGTTVSEYAPLPLARIPQEAVAEIFRLWARRTQLLILKDIPDQSPLLGDDANRFATELLANCVESGYFIVEGQALAYVPIDFASTDEFLSRLSSGRRRDIRRKLRVRETLDLEILETGCKRLQDEHFLAELYAQYLEVYAQSEIHFDQLSPAFFRAVLQDASLQGRLFLYSRQGQLIGHNLCFIHEGMLIDKYIGFRYPAAREANLYFVSWIENLNYALQQGLDCYVAGWTDPEIKAYLGASFTFTRHAVYVRNALLRRFLHRISGWFESDRQWFESDKHAQTSRS